MYGKPLQQEAGITKGTMATTHSYTEDKILIDASHCDLYHARATSLNIFSISMGAAKTVALVYPHIKGKLNGVVLCVLTFNVFIMDLVFQVLLQATIEFLVLRCTHLKKMHPKTKHNILNQ